MKHSNAETVPRPKRDIEAIIGQQRYRQARGMLPSEKMKAPVLWTTPAQRDAMTLFELHHGVCSYRAWPADAVVQVVADKTYHLPLSISLASGRTAAVDIVRHEDEGSAARRDLDRRLAQALEERGIDCIVLSERQLQRDIRLPLAREALRSAGWPVGPKAEFGCVSLLREFGGAATLSDLRATGPCGRELVYTACVLAMRRVLCLDLAAPELELCKVRIPSRVGSAR